MSVLSFPRACAGQHRLSHLWVMPRCLVRFTAGGEIRVQAVAEVVVRTPVLGGGPGWLDSLWTATTLLRASLRPSIRVTGGTYPYHRGTKAWGGFAACGSPGDSAGIPPPPAVVGQRHRGHTTSAADHRVPQLSLR